MRVIAGEARGRVLRGPPPGSSTRPTPDRVREALFQILGDIDGLRVLDLFAGTGALGIEALSRGARSATFVEGDRRVARVLEQNVAKAGVGSRSTILRMEVLAALAGPLSAPRPVRGFDLVLADPPYGSGLLPRTLEAVVAVAAPGATVVAEHATRDAPPAAPGLALFDSRRYGDTTMSFYRLTEAPT
ncbi:MAG: 16S rRNA (guanine(966)-N(2))-methyltransferase RsmD [Deltaproteobacteria bacterium]|nr:16S rRNA (guanine(966)-N(2))-methyltransferase RsmD [Deltaproteobacteria bacterium]